MKNGCTLSTYQVCITRVSRIIKKKALFIGIDTHECSRTGRKGKAAVRSTSVACTRTYDKTADFTRKPGRMTHENEQAALKMSLTSVLTLTTTTTRPRPTRRRQHRQCSTKQGMPHIVQRQSAERLQQRERNARLLGTCHPPSLPRLPLVPRYRHWSRTSQPAASNRAGFSTPAVQTSESFDATSKCMYMRTARGG